MRYAFGLEIAYAMQPPRSGRRPPRTRENFMKLFCDSIHRLAAPLVVAGLATTGLIGAAQASENKIALIPGGPHPYFAPWEQAAADAKKDFNIAAVDFKVPTEGKLNLQ